MLFVFKFFFNVGIENTLNKTFKASLLGLGFVVLFIFIFIFWSADYRDLKVTHLPETSGIV